MSNSSIFRFKKFAVNQAGCAMKVNTDGVLLGALATVTDPHSILDIGTGTGVIALMLAQRFPDAAVDAVEIDPDAAATASANFADSAFASRCSCYPNSFSDYFADHPDKKFDLIVSNPPFFINSLKSAGQSKQIARHTDIGFFSALFSEVKGSLTAGGRFWMILPVNTAEAVRTLAVTFDLYLSQQITIGSFESSDPHRHVLSFSHQKQDVEFDEVVIYSSPGGYGSQYSSLLKEFLTIF